MRTTKRPNIILLFPDQWRGDFLGHLGHADAVTPWVDELAAEGTSYTRCFTPAPTCIPARMALLTGMSPWANGRTGYEDNVRWTPPHTLPGLLRDAGYQTMQSGKTHFHPMRAHLGFEINDIYEASAREPGVTTDYHHELARALPLVEDPALKRNANSWVVTPWTATREWHPTEWITRKAIERLERRDPTRPFFLQVDWHRPHPPFDPPVDIWEQWRSRPVSEPVMGNWSDPGPVQSRGVLQGPERNLNLARALEARRAYLASIQHVDEQVGRLLWHLRRLELEDTTWVVMASDHGEFLGDHGRWHKAEPNAASARVPLVIRPPAGRRHTPAIDRSPRVLTDLMPSILGWAGVSVPDLCDSQALDAPACDVIHAEHQDLSDGWHAYFDDRWAYHRYIDGTERLFDHLEDPGELHECLGDHPDVAAAFRERLIAQLYERRCGGSDGRELVIGHRIGPTQDRSWAQ